MSEGANIVYLSRMGRAVKPGEKIGKVISGPNAAFDSRNYEDRMDLNPAPPIATRRNNPMFAIPLAAVFIILLVYTISY